MQRLGLEAEVLLRQAAGCIEEMNQEAAREEKAQQMEEAKAEMESVISFDNSSDRQAEPAAEQSASTISEDSEVAIPVEEPLRASTAPAEAAALETTYSHGGRWQKKNLNYLH